MGLKVLNKIKFNMFKNVELTLVICTNKGEWHCGCYDFIPYKIKSTLFWNARYIHAVKKK